MPAMCGFNRWSTGVTSMTMKQKSRVSTRVPAGGVEGHLVELKDIVPGLKKRKWKDSEELK